MTLALTRPDILNAVHGYAPSGHLRMYPGPFRGRGMDTGCIAVIASTPSALVVLGAALYRSLSDRWHDGDDIAALIRPRVEALGREAVAYWPDVPYQEV